MATVNLEINGRSYAVGCADGQEKRVRLLGQQFDGHVRQVASDVGQVGELRLFLMAALMLADELHDVRQRLEEGRGPVDQDGPQKAPPPPSGGGGGGARHAGAARIEKICQGL